MFNPQMMQMAQEMMSQMTPEQMQAMMSNMGNVNPNMMQQAMQQMQNMSPTDMENMRRQMNSMDSATMASQAQQAAKHLSAQQQYIYSGSVQLKAEGNKLHSAGKYADAAEKYARAKENLSDMDTQEARDLRRACVLNLGSCYLNMGKHQQCVAECDEVLQSDAQNLKALYRRGQAHAALEHHQQAEEDLQRSLELSANDPQQQPLIREKLKAVQDKRAELQQRQQQQSRTADHAADAWHSNSSEQTTTQLKQQSRHDAEDGAIEEITDDRPQWQKQQSDTDDYAGIPVLEEIGTEQPSQQQTQRQEESSNSRRNQQQAAADSSISGMPGFEGLSAAQRAHMDQVASMMKANPDMSRQAVENMSNLSASEIADMSRQAGLPLSLEAISEMQHAMSSMRPEQMEFMMKMSTMQKDDPAAVAEALGKNPELFKSAAKMMQSMPKEHIQAAMTQSGMSANFDPAIMSIATEALSNMPPEQLEQMAKMAASMHAGMGAGPSSSSSRAPQPAAAAPPQYAASSASRSTAASSPAESAAGNGEPSAVPATTLSASPAASAGARSPAAGPPDMSAMMTPEMMKMAADMMQNMKPEDLSAMQQTMAGAGAAGGLPPGAEQMMTPEMMKMAASMMRNMKPEDLAAMQQMVGGTAGAGAAGGPPTAGGGMPTGWSDMLCKMNPQMVESMFTSLQAMDEESLAQMFKGMAGSEDQAAAMAAQVKKLSPSHVRMISKAAGVVQGGVQVAQAVRQWVASNLVIMICILVLVIAVLLRWYGVM